MGVSSCKDSRSASRQTWPRSSTPTFHVACLRARSSKRLLQRNVLALHFQHSTVRGARTGRLERILRKVFAVCTAETGEGRGLYISKLASKGVRRLPRSRCKKSRYGSSEAREGLI